MQNLSLRERLAMTAVAAALLLLTVGGLVLRARGAAAGEAPVVTRQAEAEGTLEVAAQGDEDAAAAAPSPAPMPSGEPPAPGPVPPDRLVVFVTGAVRRPGVYTLRPGDRLYHAVRAAGGFKPNARQDALNLADAVQDADQVCIPTRDAAPAVARPAPSAPRREIRLADQTTAPAAPPAFVRRGMPYATILKPIGRAATPGRVLGVRPVPVMGAIPSPVVVAGSDVPPGSPAAASEGEAPTKADPGGAEKFKNPGDGTVDLNSATLADLQRLPGVGPSTAQRILDYRQEVGRFTDAKQLMDVKGIGEKKFAKMQPFVVVN